VNNIHNFSILKRNQHLNEIQQTVFDVFIVGGGITGAGIALDAASRGLKVLLIEQNDFASGTSSRST
jgi:glycerol-3-phosphate dehydrogenase